FRSQISWPLPAPLVLLGALLWLTRRTPRTGVARAAMILWGGWLLVTGLAISLGQGIIHPYYTVALAPAIGAIVGIGSVALWRRRHDLDARLFLAAAVAVTGWWSAHLLARTPAWHPLLRHAVLLGGLVTGAMIAAGPGTGGGRAGGTGGILDSSSSNPALTAALKAHADRYTWAAAAVSANQAAGFQLASGEPVMAIGGFNGTDPSPTLAQFQALVRPGRIHYFIGGGGGFRSGGLRGGSGGDSGGSGP